MMTLQKQVYYYRCYGCLLVATTNEQISGAICGACGGNFELLGRVSQRRLVADEVKSACDARCTNAVGPSCNCQCDGINHGTGKLVEVVRDLGPVPVFKPDSANLEKHAALGAEFKKYINLARQAAKDKLSSGYVPKPLWIDATYGIDRLINKAKTSKTQATRIKLLTEFIEYMK